ncbi:Clp1/GlmU family protein [Methanocaldococcus sp.]
MINKAEYITNVPEDRKELLEKIKKENYNRIMVIGAMDSGKTTLINYIKNNLDFYSILDCDVGQKSILPPATISLMKGFEVKHYFIGSVTPVGYFEEVIFGSSKLIEDVENVLIDTTGLVFGSGEDLKRLKIKVLKPDLIIALEREGELNHILRYYDGDVVRLKVAEEVKRFNRDERRKIREEKWRSYFNNSNTLEFTMDKLRGAKIFQGREIDVKEKNLLENLFKWEIFRGVYCDKYYVVKRDLENVNRVIDKNTLFYLDPERFKGLIVGLIKDDLCLGLGVIEEMDFKNEIVRIKTPIEVDNVDEIKIGRIKLEFLVDKVVETFLERDTL